MNSFQGEVFYNAAEEWSNFDVMDVISFSFCAFLQLQRGGRMGSYATFCITIAFNNAFIQTRLHDIMYFLSTTKSTSTTIKNPRKIFDGKC